MAHSGDQLCDTPPILVSKGDDGQAPVPVLPSSLSILPCPVEEMTPVEAESKNDFFSYITRQRKQLLERSPFFSVWGVGPAPEAPSGPLSSPAEVAEDGSEFRPPPLSSSAAVAAARSGRRPATSPRRFAEYGFVSQLLSSVALPGMRVDPQTCDDAVSTVRAEVDAMVAHSRSAAPLSSPGDSISLATAAPPHTHHRLELAQFYLPTLCTVCRNPTSPPLPGGPTPATPAAAATSPNVRRASLAEPSDEGLPGETAAAPPMTPLMAFGTEGYRCIDCGLTLHRSCLRALPAGETYAIAAPPPRPYPSAVAAAASSSSTTEKAASWDRLKQILATYFDPKAVNCGVDESFQCILSGLYSMLDGFAARYPKLSPRLVMKNTQLLYQLIVEQQALYKACVESLSESSLLTTVKWGGAAAAEIKDGLFCPAQAAAQQQQQRRRRQGIFAMRRLSMDTSFFSGFNIGATAVMNQAVSSPISDDVEVAPVQHLLWEALRYAIAAYGAVYRRGSLSNLLSAAYVYTVGRSSATVSKSANDEAVVKLLDLPPSALRLSRWSTVALEPSYILLVDDAASRIVVSFRGTLNTADILTDVAACGEPFCGGYAHQGAARVVNSLFDHRASQYGRHQQADGVCSDSSRATAEPSRVSVARGPFHPLELSISPKPDGLLDALEALIASKPSYAVWITGHSLGAGVAVLFATRLHHDAVFPPAVQRRFHVITFAPMPSLTLPAASYFDALSCHRADGGCPVYCPPDRHAYTQQAMDSLYSDGETVASASVAMEDSSSSGGGGRSKLASPLRKDENRAASPPAASEAVFPIWSVVNTCDFVPRLQLNSIDRLLQLLFETETQQQQEATTTATATAADPCEECSSIDATSDGCNRDEPLPSVSPAAGAPPAVGDVAAMAEEVGEACSSAAVEEQYETAETTAGLFSTPEKANCLAAAPAGKDLSHELHHPGRVLLCTGSLNGEGCRLLDVPRGHAVMHELFLTKLMVVQHMVDEYSTALLSIRQVGAAGVDAGGGE